MGAMERYCEDHVDDRANPLLLAHQNALFKLQKYYQKSDDAHTIYAAATLFCPETRYQYFLDNWDTPNASAYRELMLQTVKDHYVKHYSGQVLVEERPQKRPHPLDVHLRRVALSTSGDQFDQYIHGVRTRLAAPVELNILSWWAESEFTQLRQMAFDLLSIPATSCAIERVFSSTQDLISPDQASMTEATIESRELLRNWWQQGIVQQQYYRE